MQIHIFAKETNRGIEPIKEFVLLIKYHNKW